MKTFQDKFGQTWVIDLDLFKARQIEAYDFGPALKLEEEHFISFFPPQEDLFNSLITDPAVCFGMIWVLVQDQLPHRTYEVKDEKGSVTSYPIQSELDFTRCFDGEVISKARLAFYEELPDFFPQMKITLNNLISRYSRAEELIDERTSKAVTKKMSDQELEKEIDRAIEEALAPEAD